VLQLEVGTKDVAHAKSVKKQDVAPLKLNICCVDPAVIVSPDELLSGVIGVG
jgi:hypothetical protein